MEQSQSKKLALSTALNKFSQKLNRFSKADDANLKIQPSESTKFADALKERNEKLKIAVVATYKIYKSPFEALGTKSARADAIVKDEEALEQAYSIYKGCMKSQDEISSGKSNETSGSNVNATLASKKDVIQTYIQKLEIHSPLTEKASYTTGGQFIYLIAYLFYEKNCTEYTPFFTQIGGTPETPAIHYALNFEKTPTEPTEKSVLEERDLEILKIIKKEFYAAT